MSCVSLPVLAQEHFTEGPVWECNRYKVRPGMWDTYMEFIRANAAVSNAEAKKQGLIVDYKFYVKPPTSPSDWDVMTCNLYRNYAQFDYDKTLEDKWDAITAARLKTQDRKKQAEMMKGRLEMRDFVGTIIFREVTLRPMP